MDSKSLFLLESDNFLRLLTLRLTVFFYQTDKYYQAK